ncbi:MAG TPA: PaaI family thioesterase [Tepidisphaeraceae bacterium]|nr:PaaI family thioesterase [Tepidisphaeraceae bacterium]
MPTLELPHTLGCLVCSRDNVHGLHLSLFVDPDASIVTTDFTPQPANIGFQGIVHGGVIATVMDEAMVWAATWVGRRFCLCGELTTRFRRPAEIGRRAIVEAKVEFRNPRLIQTAATLRDESNQLLATASGKYVPVSLDQHVAFLATLVDEPATTTAANLLRTAR